MDMVRLKHPTGSGVGFDGQEYGPDEKGVVTVPANAAAALKNLHGFVDAPFDDDAAGPDEVVGEYAIKHQGRGLWMILKGDETIAKGMTKPDAESKVAELSKPVEAA